MSEKMNAYQREIVLVPYPFSDLEGMKVRPALIISNDAFNKDSKDYVVLPLTSVLKGELYSIPINQNDMQSGTLLKTSIVRADKIFTLDKSLIKMRIGMIKKEVFDKIMGEVRKVL